MLRGLAMGRKPLLVTISVALVVVCVLDTSWRGTTISLEEIGNGAAHAAPPLMPPRAWTAANPGMSSVISAGDPAGIMQRAGALQKDAASWMAKGKIHGGGLDMKMKKMCNDKMAARSILCGTGVDPSESEIDAMFGVHGTIPSEVAKGWMSQYEANGGARVPEGSFFDATNSDVWSGGGANRQWSVTGRPYAGGWTSPSRWVAARRSIGRNGVAETWHGHTQVGGYGDEFSEGARWPYGYGPQSDDEGIPMSKYGDRGQGTPQQFLDGVIKRYNNPTHSRFMEEEYKRLGAGQSTSIKRMEEAVRQLDWEANMAIPTLDRLRKVPVDSVQSKSLVGDQEGVTDFLKKVQSMRFSRHTAKGPDEVELF